MLLKNRNKNIMFKQRRKKYCAINRYPYDPRKCSESIFILKLLISSCTLFYIIYLKLSYIIKYIFK